MSSTKKITNKVMINNGNCKVTRKPTCLVDKGTIRVAYDFIFQHVITFRSLFNATTGIENFLTVERE